MEVTDLDWQTPQEKSSRRRNGWLLCALAGGGTLLFAFFLAGILENKQSARNIPGVLILGLVWIICISRSSMHGRIAKNLRRNGSGRAMGGLLIHGQCPYALYLRNFGPEEDFADTAPTGEFRPAPNNVPRAEAEVLDQLASHIPILAMSHPQDFNSRPVAIRLPTEGRNWKKKFDRYAERASLVVLRLEDLTPGAMFEFNWIIAKGVGERAVLIFSRQLLATLRKKYGPLIDDFRWIVTHEKGAGKCDYPATLINYLSSLDLEHATIEMDVSA